MAQTERSTDIAKPPEDGLSLPLRARPRPAVDDGPQRLRAARRRPAPHRLALPRAARRLRPAHRRRARDHRLRPARRRRDAHGDPRHRRHQQLRARARRRRHPPHADDRGDGRRAEGPGADPGHPAPPREEARRRSRGAQGPPRLSLAAAARGVRGSHHARATRRRVGPGDHPGHRIDRARGPALVGAGGHQRSGRAGQPDVDRLRRGRGRADQLGRGLQQPS